MAAKFVNRTCQQCDQTFRIRESRLKYGCGKFCSPKCQGEASRNRVTLVCQTCEKPFEITASRVGDRGQGKFCSIKCKRYEREPNESRFRRFVTIPDDPDACWGWQGSCHHFGYGQIRDSSIGRQIAAHKMSYILHIGEVPDGQFVLHKCDNPPCTNPRHLFLGTKKDNSEDMVQKCRSAQGSKHFNAKLDEQSVTYIRSRAGHQTLVSLAYQFGVSPATIEDAVARRTWKHIP